MSTGNRDRITAAFEDELSGASLPPGFREEVVRDAVRRPRARTGEGYPRALAFVAALLAIAIVATLVFVAKQPHPAPVKPRPVLPVSGLALDAIAIYGDSGWASSGNALLKTADGAMTWTNVTPSIVKAEALAGYFPIDSDRAWLATFNTVNGQVRVWTTADGGSTWSVATTPAPQPIRNPLLFADGTNGWLATPGEPTSEFQQQPIVVTRTVDGGRSWQRVGAPPDVCGKQDMSFLNATTGWITGGCLAGITFEVTSDGGRTWKAQKLASPDGKGFTLDCDAGPCSLSAPRFAGPSYGYMVLNDYDNAHDSHRSTLYVTRDGGRTWSLRPLPAGDLRVTMINPSTGYAAAAQARPSGWLYRTDDGGLSWHSVAASIQPESNVLDCTSTTTCFLPSTTHLYKTVDGGATWTDLTGSPAPLPSPSPDPKALLGRGWTIGSVVAMTVTTDAVFALYVPPGTQGEIQGSVNTMLARIDRSSGSVKTAGPFPGALSVAPGGPWIWLTATHALVQMDPATLREMNSTSLPGAASNADASVAGNQQGLWLAYGSSLYRIDTSSGQPMQTASLDGEASGLSIDPIGRQLYVGSTACGPDAGGVVSEWDATNLRKVASVATPAGCTGGPRVSASKDGVWVSYATGNLGTFEHRRAGDLANVASGNKPMSNAIRTFALWPMVWLLDPGVGRVACLSNQSGNELVAWDEADLPSVIAGDSQHVYLGDNVGLHVVNVDPRCQ